MSAETELHYLCKPTEPQQASCAVEFLSVQEFLADELSCKTLWDLLSEQFRTRSKFLAIWQCVPVI